MNISTFLAQTLGYVTAKDFAAVGVNLGQFATTAPSLCARLQEHASLLHAPHASGLTLMSVCTERFVPRKHGTWCVVASLGHPVDIQTWTEVIPPADFTGDLVACSVPHVSYRCDIGAGVFVPQSQFFSVEADHHIEVLLLFGEHPNHTWPSSRFYAAHQHAERTLRYPDTPVIMLEED